MRFFYSAENVWSTNRVCDLHTRLTQSFVIFVQGRIFFLHVYVWWYVTVFYLLYAYLRHSLSHLMARERINWRAWLSCCGDLYNIFYLYTWYIYRALYRWPIIANERRMNCAAEERKKSAFFRRRSFRFCINLLYNIICIHYLPNMIIIYCYTRRAIICNL